MRLGVRAHDFGKLPVDELAARIAARGVCCVQLALNKAIAELDLKPGDLNPGLAFHVGQAFARHGIQVAVLGCYINPIHPDPVARAALLGWFKEHLRFARDFGCGVVALESGSMNADYSPHAENHGEAAFQTMLASIAELVAEAERCGVMVGLEAVAIHTVSTPRKARRVLDAIGSNHLQVVFDPVNLLTPQNHREQQRVVEESLELFGDRIVAVHAKDFVIEADGLRTVPAGRGQFTYGPLLRHLAARKPLVSILLEEAGEDAVTECADFLARAAG